MGRKSIHKTVYPALSGYDYDDTDPVATGCSTDAYTAQSALIQRAYDFVTLQTIELRYSPSCRTAWGRITIINDSSLNYGHVELYRF